MTNPRPEPRRVRLRLANKAMLDAPIYKEHQRGSNWLAIIDVDAKLPGGLSRRFLERGRGDCYYSIEPLALFDPVEFGADYTSMAGRKTKERWYGVVVALTEGVCIVEQTENGVEAVLRARDARVSPVDRAHALRAERDAAHDRLQDLEREIAELETAALPEQPTA